jgi:hypothetical protein
MTTEHQPGSQVDIAEFEAHGGSWSRNRLLDTAVLAVTELRTLRARVGELKSRAESAEARVKELEAIACAATVLADAGPGRTSGPMWTLLWTFLNDRVRRSLVPAMQRQGLPFTEHGGEWRSEPAPSLPSNLSNLAADTLRARAESAEARVREIERAFRNLVARIDGDGGQAQEGESVEESCERADAKVVALQARVRELENEDDEALSALVRADARITALESELSEARLDLERWHTSVEAHRLATILEQRDEARAEVKALESEVARLREEAGLEALVRSTLKERNDSLLVRFETPWWKAEWRSESKSVYGYARRVAQGATLPALLRAILEVEKGGPDED